MARRKARIPQGKKIQPSVDTMYFEYTITNSASQVNHIDLSQCASLLNRRFYRQGLQWAVAGFKVFTSDTSGGRVIVSKIPNTWVSANSWEKGFRAWQRMNEEALEDAESVRPKFLDFKVFMDSDHFAAGETGNLLPIQGLELAPGEWDYSQVVIPNPSPADPAQVSNFSIMWTGANYTGAGLTDPVVSLIEGYAASRGLPDILDPNTPTDADDASGSTPENWISAIQNEGTDQVSDVLTDMIFENNQAPYPFENAQVPGAAPGTVFTDTMYPGGANQGNGLATHDFTAFSPTTVSDTNFMKGGLFNGGLIALTSRDMTEGATVSILVELAPGPHRGYMARSMQDV